MVAKSQTKAAQAPESEAKPESSKVRASDVLEDVFKAIQAAGPEGIGLKALEEKTGLRYRVLHNVAWHLGLNPGVESPRIRKVGDGRKLQLAAVEAKPARKPRASRKATTKAPATASASKASKAA